MQRNYLNMYNSISSKPRGSNYFEELSYLVTQKVPAYYARMEFLFYNDHVRSLNYWLKCNTARSVPKNVKLYLSYILDFLAGLLVYE